MTFVHTFYSEPLYKNKFNKFEVSLNNILWDYCVSLLFAKKFGYKVKLFTDNRGKELLSVLPYDEIIVLNNTDTTPHFAASFKFYALQQCSLDDVLIDGDIILDSKIPYNIIETSTEDFVYSFSEPNEYILQDGSPNQYYETNDAYFSDLIKRMDVPGLKYDLPSLSELCWPNTSLIKFNNQQMKDEWVNQYFYHLNILKNIDFGHTWPDIIIEQYFLRKIIENGSYSIKPIIKSFPYLTEEDQELGFTHLGCLKNDYLHLMKQITQTQAPMLYNKIVQKINNELQNATK